MKLIRAAYDALPPGGAFIAVEALIDNARRENVFGLLMSLNMLIEFGDAFDYSAADFEKWCREVGFNRFEVIHLAGPSSAAIAYKQVERAVLCTPKRRRPPEWSSYLQFLRLTGSLFPGFLLTHLCVPCALWITIIGCSQLTPILAEIYGIAIYGIASSRSRIKKR